MSVINIEKYLKKKEQMLNFIIQNEEKYSLEGTRVLAEELLEDIILIKQQYNTVDMRQILSKFEVYKENKDPYQLFAKLLKQYSFLSGNCCEVGAGSYPRVTELIAPIIRKNGGKLTVYEPDILFTDFNATFIKDKFTQKTDTSNIDTLFALYPCQATIAIAEKAFEENTGQKMFVWSLEKNTEKKHKLSTGLLKQNYLLLS